MTEMANFVRGQGKFAPGQHQDQKVTIRETYKDWAVTTSGIAVPSHIARKVRRPIGIDLFSGAGGFSLGFIQAGFQVIAALDNDTASTITYMYNLGAYPCQFHFATEGDAQRLEKALRQEQGRNEKWRTDSNVDWLPGKGEIKVAMVSGGGWISNYFEHPGVQHFFFGDARNFTGQQILDAIGMKRGEVDCVMGSPPCQGFSYAGKRNVMDPRNNLVFVFARLVCEIEPRTFVFENVPGIVSMVTPDGLPIIDALCLIFEEGGFGTFDALKRGLLASSGAGAGIKGQSAKKKKSEKKQPDQARLF